MSFSSYFTHKPGGDRIFSVEAPKIKFGRGSLQEVGDDAKGLGMSRVAVYTDPRVVQLEPVAKVIESLSSSGLDFEVYDQVAVEPTDISFKQVPNSLVKASSMVLFPLEVVRLWTPAKPRIYIPLILPIFSIM